MFSALAALSAVTLLGICQPAEAQSQTQSTLQEIKNRGTLRVGWGVLFPYMYRDPSNNNQLTGFAVDFMNAMAQALGVKVEFIEDNWSTMIAGLQANKFDITLPALGITLPRAEVITYTHPIARQPIGLMVLKKNVDKYKSWQDLDKPELRITTTLGSNIDLFVTQRFKNAQIIRVKGGPDSIAQMLGGKADAWANAIEAFNMIEKERPDLAIVPGQRLGASPMAMGVRQGDFIWRDWINLFIAEMERTGRLKTMLDAHNLFEPNGTD
jgi:ABC-type amino acid transport substrate-binding protein